MKREEKLRQVDVVIPTYHPGKQFGKLLKYLMAQRYPIHKVIIMNTDECWWDSNNIAEMVAESGPASQELRPDNPKIEVHHVTKEEFDHGGTRDLGQSFSEAEIVVFLTQDAIPKNGNLLSNLMDAFENPQVAVAYARQIPAEDCRVIEAFTRSFNYPGEDRVKTKEDLPVLGVKTFFSSNVCAAYRRDLYNRLGGFTRRTIFNEDMIFAGGAVKAGYAVAYCSRAVVVHSHNYSGMEYLRRNFDLGVSQADHPEVFAGIRSESEGIRLVKKTASYLVHLKKMYLLPELLYLSGCKFLGYRLGKAYQKLPRWAVKRLTMNRGYWGFGKS